MRSRFTTPASAALAWDLSLSIAGTLAAAPKGGKGNEKGKAKPAPAAPTAPEPPPPPPGPKPLSETLSGEALAAYEAGKLLYSDGDYAGALVKLQAAYDLAKDPRLLWNMAACEKNLRHYARVLALVRRYLETGGDLLVEQDRKDAKDLLTTVESFTAALTLTVNEPGAEVYVDNELVGTTPLPEPVVVDIGVRSLRVKKAGFKEHTGSVPVGGAAAVRAAVKLDPEVHQGRLTVNTRKGSSISLDGKIVGHGTWSGTIASGGHTLRVTAPGMRAYQSEVVIQDDETRGVDVALEPLPKAAPSVEETGPLNGFELGVRTGYGVAARRDAGKVDFIPLWLDIGYRLGRPSYLGIYGQWGYFDRSGTCGIDRPGPGAAASPTDLSVRYSYEKCNFLKFGVMLVFHVLPRTIVDPWFGFDAGVHASFARYRSRDPLDGSTTQGNDNNASFQPGFQLGVDTHPWLTTGFGVFAHVGPEFGGEGEPKDELTQQNCLPQGPCNSSPQEDHGTHVTGHYLIGLRAAYTFP